MPTKTLATPGTPHGPPHPCTFSSTPVLPLNCQSNHHPLPGSPQFSPHGRTGDKISSWKHLCLPRFHQFCLVCSWFSPTRPVLSGFTCLISLFSLMRPVRSGLVVPTASMSQMETAVVSDESTERTGGEERSRVGNITQGMAIPHCCPGTGTSARPCPLT